MLVDKIWEKIDVLVGREGKIGRIISSGGKSGLF